MDQNRRCVFVADDPSHAEAVVGWLAAQDISARALDASSLGGMDGLGAVAGAGAHGLEVWVDAPDDAEMARRLLIEFEARRRADRAAHSGTVDVVCEECGKGATFPAAEQGTVQECPHCGGFLDVPEPDDEWDVGVPDDRDGEE
jgi:hypothetical protein